MKKLAILSTHPIQYNAPLFRLLHDDDQIQLIVFFSKTWDQVKFDPDFQREVRWDIPLSDGYSHLTFDASQRSGKKDLAAAIRAFAPDALLVYGWNFPGHYAMMRKFHGTIPIWFRGDSHLLNPLPFWKRALRRAMLTWVYGHVDMAFTVGTANAEYYRWSGLTSDQLRLAPHAVDNNFWSSQQSERTLQANQWRQELGIPSDSRVVGFAGKIEPIKQVRLSIQSALSSDTDCFIVVAGTGPLEEEIHSEFSGEERVRLLGFVNQSQMPLFYRMIDLLVLASTSETWGLSINESIASGTPCLVSNRAGCSVDLTPTDWVTSIAPENAQAWSHAIHEKLNAAIPDDSWRQQFMQKHSYGAFADAIHTEFTT